MRFWAVAGLPAQDGDLLEVGLAALDDQGALVDVRLERVHRAVEEERGVVVVRAAGEQLDVERALAVDLLAARVDQTQAGQQRRGLLDADLEVVEGGVVVDVRRAADQPVVGDDRDVLLLRLARTRSARCRRSRR